MTGPADAEDSLRRCLALMDRLGVEGEVLRHGDGTRTVDAERALGVPADQILKTLVLTDGRRSVAAVLGGDRRLDVRALRAAAGTGKLRFLSAEALPETVGFPLGGVPPFAPVGRMDVFLDRGLLDRGQVVGAGGAPTVGIRLDPKDLLRAGLRPADIVAPER